MLFPRKLAEMTKIHNYYRQGGTIETLEPSLRPGDLLQYRTSPGDDHFVAHKCVRLESGLYGVVEHFLLGGSSFSDEWIMYFDWVNEVSKSDGGWELTDLEDTFQFVFLYGSSLYLTRMSYALRFVGTNFLRKRKTIYTLNYAKASKNS